MGVRPEEIDGALRLSWCHDTALENLDRMICILRRLQGEAPARKMTKGVLPKVSDE
jgi:cysteine sulfinate desulfinase/cysteine desulfurase-like protein